MKVDTGLVQRLIYLNLFVHCAFLLAIESVFYAPPVRRHALLSCLGLPLSYYLSVGTLTILPGKDIQHKPGLYSVTLKQVKSDRLTDFVLLKHWSILNGNDVEFQYFSTDNKPLVLVLDISIAHHL